MLSRIRISINKIQVKTDILWGEDYPVRQAKKLHAGIKEVDQDSKLTHAHTLLIQKVSPGAISQVLQG